MPKAILNNGAWDIKEEYFSGQGSVLAAIRNANGTHQGFFHCGNVPELLLKTAIKKEEHRENKTGTFGKDMTIDRETDVTMSAVFENFGSSNLELFLRAVLEKIAGGTLADSPVTGYLNRISGLEHLRISNVVVKAGTVTLTPFVNETTPYDYKVNTESGSIQVNGDNYDKLGVTITGVSVGATTTLTVTNPLAQVGQKVALRGFTGTDAAFLNGQSFNITEVTSTTVKIDVDTTSKTVTTAVGTKAVFDSMPLLVSYSYVDQVKLKALSGEKKEIWLRFEGLNTAKQKEPVVIDVFKIALDPLQELSALSDKTQATKVEGTVLVDNTRTDGSYYYNVRKLA